MFTKNHIETQLDAEITSLLRKLKETTKDSEDYGKLLERLSKLHSLKMDERPRKRINPDTVLVVAANIFGILWLARYERENVIKSRNALSFVMKPR